MDPELKFLRLAISAFTLLARMWLHFINHYSDLKYFKILFQSVMEEKRSFRARD